MALPILDGNQTATTLSTVVSAGAHIPAHTVVSLGAQAITDMRSAVSGSVVSISNLPATQTIAGTVTANVSGQYYSGSGNIIYPISVGEEGEPFNVGAGRVAVEIVDKDGNSTLESIAGYSAEPMPSKVLAVGGYNSIDNELRPIPIYGIYDPIDSGQVVGIKGEINGTVTASVTNSVTVGSLPVQLSTTTIGGTSRLNVTLSSATTVGGAAPSYANLHGGSDGTNLRAILTDTNGRTVVTGTVGVSGTVPVSGTFWQATQPVSLTSLPSLAAGTAQIGSVTASISGTPTVTMGAVTGSVSILGTPSVTMGAISGTVTASVSALPSGALTTRFGSVTTANLAQISTAVTNTSRKYLLAQNISAGTVTIGIGFSPTTTQGIQLTAGAGITFDSFCPTGAVYWLGATTGANFTILEG